jgi:hypothetical protein
MLPPLPILLQLLVVIAILRLTLEGYVSERVMQQLAFGSERTRKWRVQSGYTGPGGVDYTLVILNIGGHESHCFS